MKQYLVRLRCTGHEAVDALGVLVTAALGLAGFHRAFGGWSFLTVGIIGCVLGILAGHLLHRVTAPMLLKFAVGAVVFLVFAGPVAVRSETIAGVIPTADAVTGVVDGMIAGWRRLLTTLPPSGDYGNLLAVPYLCGYLCGFVGLLLSRQAHRLLWLVVTPGAVLVASLLFGTRTPFSVLVQGSLFACASIAWLAVRKARDHRRYLQASGRKRLVGATVMLALVGVLANQVAPHLPLVEARERYVLRDRTEPPFDPRVYGSPLNAFQKYLIGDLHDKVMFIIEGVPEAAFRVDGADRFALVRLAVMDEYDGVVWQVSPGGAAIGSQRSGRFIRVGEEVPVEVPGEEAEIAVEVKQLPGVWLPDLGAVTGISWSGPRAAEQREAFRLSLLTSTGLVPIRNGWREGDSFRFRAVVSPPPDVEDLAGQDVNAQVGTSFSVPVPKELTELAATITRGKSSVYEQAKAIEEYLRAGYYASGDREQDQPNSPGHSYARLLRFIANPKPVGNAEQYAAAMAVLARTVGIPARVVMGFKVDETGVVEGRDVHAWVELGFEEGWVAFDPTSTSAAIPQTSKREPRPRYESQDVPPPPVVPPEPTINTRQKSEGKSEEAEPDEEVGASDGVAGWIVALAVGLSAPILLLVGFSAVVLWLKHRRRQQRRSAEGTFAQVAGGWDEFLDSARDAGLPVAATSTRREAALLVGSPAAPALAFGADRAVFGRLDPSPDAVDIFWSDVIGARRELHAPLSLWGRIRAHLSLTSLRRAR